MTILPNLLQILGFFIATAFASGPVPITEQELAQKLKKYQSITHLKTKFKQEKTFKDLSLKLKSEGSCEIQRPGKVTWQVVKPSHVKVAMTENEFQIVTGQGKEQTVQKIKLSEVTASQKKSMTELVSWLELDANKLSSQYNIFKSSENEFIFYPKEKKENPFNSLNLKMDAKGNLSQLMIDEASGDTLRIYFEPPQILRAN